MLLSTTDQWTSIYGLPRETSKKVVRSDGRLAKGYKFGGPIAQKCRLLADGIIFTPSDKIKKKTRRGSF